jgi:hypothetical protein
MVAPLIEVKYLFYCGRYAYVENGCSVNRRKLARISLYEEIRINEISVGSN